MKNGRQFGPAGWAIILLLVICTNSVTVAAQQPMHWSPSERIPDFQSETWPPLMVADQNRTVHAFSSQWLGEDEGDPVRAIMYNQWTLAQGWTTPVDILLSPSKDDARLTGVFLDQSGIIHVTFFGGDNTEANIYYAKAAAVAAGRATAWSTPVVMDRAGDPELAILVGDDQGNLAIVYSGLQAGKGLYARYSADEGDTWTDPAPTFLTYDDEFYPVILKIVPDQSGWFNAIWDVRNRSGQGREINYARLNLGDKHWSEPVTLAEVEAGYGVLLPTIAEHRGELFVAYNGVSMRRSSDGGQTWTDPVKPFRQVGVNGTMSFVVDSNDNLHFLWAQRVTGSPDIHGTWHSVWQDGRWSEPEAIVSGPAVSDSEGDKAFDPFEVRAIISQGNVLLATWRMDPGLKGNGVWYSYLPLNAPELPVVPLPTVLPTPTLLSVVTATPARPTPTAAPRPVFSDQPPPEAGASLVGENPGSPLLFGLVPVIFLISAIIFRSLFAGQNRR